MIRTLAFGPPTSLVEQCGGTEPILQSENVEVGPLTASSAALPERDQACQHGTYQFSRGDIYLWLQMDENLSYRTSVGTTE